jgi:predicted nuclease of restriction endonuclease-like (RecB) superfamily
MENIENLASQILNTHQYFNGYANKQVNYAYTMRNWLIGMYLFEYEQKGKERAEYGEKLYKNLATILKGKNLKGMSFTMLHTYKQFYLTYPQIVRFLTEQFQDIENQSLTIVRLPTEQLRQNLEATQPNATITSISVDNPSAFISKISFTHISEFLKIEDSLKRAFYEIQTLKNNWTVKQLQREMNTLLYERIGLSMDKEQLLENLKTDNISSFTEIVKSPYLLEFLGIPEQSAYSETDLEQAIINHLQSFLIEMGRGFCFEARQKRISFNNRHYRIDLVFYHRILKCHILIDLKIGEFDHADAGQMNVYLNYYKENEMAEHDNPPIGIILCSDKDNALVHYATGGLPHEVFVSKYQLQLPSEAELKQIIERDIKDFNIHG